MRARSGPFAVRWVAGHQDVGRAGPGEDVRDALGNDAADGWAKSARQEGAGSLGRIAEYAQARAERYAGLIRQVQACMLAVLKANPRSHEERKVTITRRRTVYELPAYAQVGVVLDGPGHLWEGRAGASPGGHLEGMRWGGGAGAGWRRHLARAAHRFRAQHGEALRVRKNGRQVRRRSATRPRCRSCFRASELPRSVT